MHTIGPESGRKAFEIYRRVCMEDNLRERTQKVGRNILKLAENWDNRRARVDFIYFCCFLLCHRVEY